MTSTAPVSKATDRDSGVSLAELVAFPVVGGLVLALTLGGLRWLPERVWLDILKANKTPTSRMEGDVSVWTGTPEHIAETMLSYRKVGFRPVGIMRRYWRDTHGRWRDGLLLDLLAGELT